MKKVKWGIIALLAGELIAIFRTDKKFRSEFKNKSGRDALVFVVERLFTFNKDLVLDTKESIENFDLKENIDHIKSFLQKEVNILKKGVQYAQDNLETLKDEKLMPMLEELLARYESVKQMSGTIAGERIDKLGVKNTLEEIKKQIDALTNRTNKKS